MSRVRVLFNNETFLGIVRATLGLFALAALVESDALPAVVRVRTAVYSAVQQFWLDSIVYYDASPPKALAMLILITHMVQVCWLLCVAISAYASLLTSESFCTATSRLSFGDSVVSCPLFTTSSVRPSSTNTKFKNRVCPDQPTYR